MTLEQEKLLKYIIKGILKYSDYVTQREQNILEFRFGINDGKSKTLEECGKEFGVTRERIRQIEFSVLGKMVDELNNIRCEIYRD